MNIETHPAPHEFLTALYYQVHGFEPDFPSPSDLQMLGIQAETSPEISTRRFQYSQSQQTTHIEGPYPDPEDYLKDEDRDPSPDPEAKLEDAKFRLRWALRDRDEYKHEWYTHADQVHGHICQEVFARRKGPTGTFYSCDLVGQSLWS
ncbi:hypothetical protein PENSOL_c052G04214 [Penicillium solitum]|uniref:Uncharacterized protein n=1 Tax=Penicillium solitum TaxID=60172 RepID=A0A1V6QQL8_9EURO|nr:uncharacterized protein PENSOL_c052G04214 [Penicillium solitum]OQD91524.1 hypothetical protein PENSOL_c052G04214 [Penicillium solitum]